MPAPRVSYGMISTLHFRLYRPASFPVTLADRLLDEASCDGVEQYYDVPGEEE